MKQDQKQARFESMVETGHYHNRVHSWLSMMDPEHAVIHSGKMSLTAAVSKPTVSNAALTGSSADQALTNGNAIPTNLPDPNTDPTGFQNFVNKFAQAPTSGLATILDLARINAGYNPLMPSSSGDENHFNAYLTNVNNCPFLHLNKAQTDDVQKESSDWNTMIDSIVDLYEGIDSNNRAKIVQSLGNLAKSATSRKDTNQTTSLFLQSTISTDDSSIKLYMYRSYVTLQESSGKSDSKQSTFQLRYAIYTFDKENWPQFAAAVARKKVTKINDWLNKMDTKADPANKLAGSCIA